MILFPRPDLPIGWLPSLSSFVPQVFSFSQLETSSFAARPFVAGTDDAPTVSQEENYQ
jgi:hypothetical protein